MTLEEKLAFVDTITTKKALRVVYFNINDNDIKAYIIEKIFDNNFLFEIVKNESSLYLCNLALSKITDEDTINKIALNNNKSEVRYKATEKISDEVIFATILLKDDNCQVRLCAARKLNNKVVHFNF